MLIILLEKPHIPSVVLQLAADRLLSGTAKCDNLSHPVCGVGVKISHLE